MAWCEALFSDVGGRSALRVLLERGVKFGISGNSFQVLQMKIDDIKGWKNTHLSQQICQFGAHLVSIWGKTKSRILDPVFLDFLWGSILAILGVIRWLWRLLKCLGRYAG